jgi:hypothetical protein
LTVTPGTPPRHPGNTLPAQLTRTELNAAALLSSVEAAVFGWAAAALPWQSFTLFSLLALTLAALKLATALAALFVTRFAVRLWRLSALGALILLAWVSWTVFTGGAYIAGLYGSLGQGLFAALLAIWGLAVLLTLPTAVWALVRTRRARGVNANSALVLGALALAFVVRSGWLDRVAKGVAVQGEALSKTASDAEQNETSFAEELSALREQLAANRAAPSAGLTAIGDPPIAECEHPPDRQSATLFATYARSNKSTERFSSVCVQGDTLAQASERLSELLTSKNVGLPVRVDRVRRVASLEHGPDWSHTFEVRPGLDGACLGPRCWSAWQLVVRDTFLENQPLSFVKDLKFGASHEHLARLLASTDAESDGSDQDEHALIRIETASWVLNGTGVHPEHRMRPVPEALDRLTGTALQEALRVNDEQVANASAALQRYILGAQKSDGHFRYLLHPFSGFEESKNFNLARQAGTTFILCEIGDRTSAVDSVIEKALRSLTDYERVDTSGLRSGFNLNPRVRSVALEESALPLIAFLGCRARMGPRFDTTIARVSQLLLDLQRADGGLAPSYDLDRNAKKSGVEPLFGPGQASLALVLLEKLLRSGELGFSSVDAVRQTRHALLDYTKQKHWPKALYPFFFVEENWHCLAAREMLSLERDPEYERFCLDYVTFKSRQILDWTSQVDPLFVGGMGFGNVVPPHNTGSAGFGEALSAAIAIRHASGEPVDAEQRLLRRVLGFLVRQQWTLDNCVGCVPEAIGSIPEHTHSPITRIDFAQHTWAALEHGRQMLLL